MQDTIIFTGTLLQVVLNIYLYFLIFKKEKNVIYNLIAGAILVLFIFLKLEYISFENDGLGAVVAWSVYNCSHALFIIHLLIRTQWKLA